MKKTSKIYILPAVMVGITTITGIAASVPGVNAEDISPVDDEITVTVDSSCTMGIMSSSSMTGIIPGETKNIGAYRMAAYCNDSNGYDIYAIGYTNGEYGNTNMISTDGNIIPTGTSGEDSYWNMQLIPGTASGQTTHIPTIVSPFTNNTNIPSDYTKVVTYPSTTIPQGEDPMVSGSYFGASYDAHASTTLPSGTYTGQVQYVMVHPVGAEAPVIPDISKLTYMQDFARFSQGDIAKLKATMNEGQQYTLTDRRDGKSYYIAKLADGNVWMTQNLDFSITNGGANLDSTNTDVPQDWTDAGNLTNTYDSVTWNWSTTTPESYDPGNLYWDGALNTSWSGNLDDGTVANPSQTSGGAHYHIGNYYNWTAAVAMSDSSSYDYPHDVSQSICPAGWRLPTYSGDKSYQKLVNVQGLTSGTSGNIQNNPVYFVYGGHELGRFGFEIGSSGLYWLSMFSGSNNAYVFNFGVNGGIHQNNLDRGNAYSLRCVAR